LRDLWQIGGSDQIDCSDILIDFSDHNTAAECCDAAISAK
jgi:hypothetical protein